MNQDESWAIDDPEYIDKVNQIKEQLEFNPWDIIKNEPEILENAIDNTGTKLDPASMLMSERVFFLDQIFEDVEIIPVAVDNEVLQAYSDSIDSIEMQKKLDTIIPNLKVKSGANNDKTKKQVKLLLNGLQNVKMIALTKTSHQIFPYISILKKYDKETIENYFVELKEVIGNIENNLDKTSKPKQEDINKLVAVLVRLGRTPIEAENLKNQNYLTTLDIAQKDFLSLKTIDLAYKKNQLHLLENADTMHPLLEEALRA